MKAIEVKNYRDIILDCFSSDKALTEKWHIVSGSGLENCVDRTTNDLKEFKVVFYKLTENEKLVGYFGIENGTHLTGFFIKPEFRNKEIIKEFWNIVDSKFNSTYMVGIFKKNIPAKRFLEKRTTVHLEHDQSIYFIVIKGV